MKKLYFLLFSIIFISCSKTDDSEERIVYSQNMIDCEAEDLGITREAKRLYSEEEVFFVGDTVWQWYRADTDIQIQFSYGCGDECSTKRVMNFKIQDSCIVLTEDFNSSSDFFDGNNQSFNDINFQLQKFNDSLIIGKNKETEFWVDFEEAARLDTPVRILE